MAEYILRDQAIIAVTGAKLPDVSASGLPIANGKRSVTDCVRRLKEIPAADVRPVKRGQWVESKSIMDVIYCSECGFRTIYGAMPDGLGRNYSYCPNCGADMREVTDG